jgi:hypothetical protein
VSSAHGHREAAEGAKSKPDLRALVGWHDRAYNKITATLSLHSLDEGTERRIAVDPGAGLKREGA